MPIDIECAEPVKDAGDPAKEAEKYAFDTTHRRSRILEQLNFWTSVQTGYNLTFTRQEPFTMHNGGEEKTHLPMGYVVTATPAQGIFRKPMDAVKLQKALEAALGAVVSKPDVQRTQHGVWINAGTVDQLEEAVKKSAKDSGNVPTAYSIFSQYFVHAAQSKQR